MARTAAASGTGTPPATELGTLVARLRKYELRLRQAVQSQAAGTRLSVFRGTGLEFADVRPYQYGDDVRLIDWNVSAKGHGTFTRTYREEREQQVVLLLDVSASQQLGAPGRSKLDIAREIGGVLALVAARQQARLGLVACSDRLEAWLPPDRGLPHAYRLIRTLYALQPLSPRTHLVTAIRRTLGVLRRRSLVVLLSDLLDSDFERELRMLARTHELVVLHLRDDQRERRLPGLGIVPVRDPETGRVRWMNTSGLAFRAELAAIQAQQQALAQVCRRAGARLLAVPVDQDYLPVLVELLIGRGVGNTSAAPAS